MSHKDFCHAGCSDNPTRGELLKNHGRPIDFANAVWNALGEISDYDFSICSDCKEHAEFLPECPKCESGNTSREKFSGSGAIPECTYLLCADCNHQWDHS